jgi:hypothetical protein
MKDTIRIIIATCFFQMLCLAANSQSLSVADLIRLSALSHQEATQFISTQKHFKVLNPLVKNDITISQFSKEGYMQSELVLKSEFRDQKGLIHPSINYDFKPPMYVNGIISQLKVLGFTLASKQSDATKQVWLFENSRFAVSIHAFGEAMLPANVELHGK